ncbi:MAG: helix-turn-helix transcriptional regulator [Clostridiales bacterium]|nr:helix-turn-helix transcriptional regulator [Clostridiales bacterium]
MDTINQRIAACIKESGLTKTAFAERLNVTQPFVSQLANGSKAPSDRTIADICREFGISESWLRTGEGEMFIQLSDDADFIRVMTEIQVSDDEFIKALLRSYWNLDAKEKAAIHKLVDGMIDKNKKAED